MKKLLLLVLTLMGGLSGFAQEKANLDTIYMLGQRKMVVQVKGIFYTDVKYEDPESGELETVKTKNIQKIIFDSGRKEIFNKPLVESVEESDWKNVVLTRDRSSVEDLYKVGQVKGKSSSRNRTTKSAKRTATIRMKRRAANMGGVMVLVTKEESQGGFGEVPTFYVEGIAYSFEPPKNEEEE